MNVATRGPWPGAPSLKRTTLRYSLSIESIKVADICAKMDISKLARVASKMIAPILG